MRRSIILAIVSLVALGAPADMALAASADEAMAWLAGRWTNKGDCGIGSVQFQRSGAGWSYREVLPYFKKSEDNRIEELSGSPYHGKGGPLTVEYFRY